MSIVVFGYGAIGRATTALLAARGDAVTVAQRSAPREPLPPGVRFAAVDAMSAEAVRAALGGARAAINCIGLPYKARLWASAWPAIMTTLLDACAKTGARHVFADNLYMYGPQTTPLREDMPLTTMGGKPGARAAITRQWQGAHQAGRVMTAAVRASDFYGPQAATAVLSEYGVKPLLAGKPAMAPYSPEHLHDYTYTADFARALVTLLDAPDDAYGEAWHVPNAPTRSLRQHLDHAAHLIGVKLRLSVLPYWMQPLIGLFTPAVGELAEMRFQTDRPYLVDSTKFAARFWADATPFEDGLRATIDSYRHA